MNPLYECEYLHITIPDGPPIRLVSCEVCGGKIWRGAHLTTFTLNGEVIGSSMYCPEHCAVCDAQRKKTDAE